MRAPRRTSLPRARRAPTGTNSGGAGARRVRILIADDHEVVRRGVRGLLEVRGWEVVGEAADGHEAVEMARSMVPDIVILDIAMQRLNGLEAARQIRQAAVHTEVLLLSMYDSEPLVRSVLAAGAKGYVLKSDAAHHLVSAVEAILRGGTFFTSRISQMLLDSYLTRTGSPRSEEARVVGEQLTAREREILQLLAEGKSNKQVAALLGIRVKTVETHRTNLMGKLQLHSISDIVHYAVRNKIIEP